MEEVNIIADMKEQYKQNRDAKPVKRVRKSKAKPRKNIKRRIKILSLMFIIATIVVFSLIEMYANWRTTHEWQVPLTWVGLVREKEKPQEIRIIETPILTNDEIMEQYKLAPVLKSIHLLESTSGKFDSCLDSGKVNGYGYGQNNTSWNCFDSFEEVTEKVNSWFVNRLAENGNNLAEAVCYYNTGKEWQSTCGDYSENFWSVLTNYF